MAFFVNVRIAFLTLLFSIATTRAAGDGAFDNFLHSSISNYESWVKTNNLDPSPALTVPIELNYDDGNTILHCTIRNLQMADYSHIPFAMKKLISGDVNKGYLEMQYGAVEKNLTFTGDYVLNGTYRSSIDVSGEGKLKVEVGMDAFNKSYEHYIYSEFTTSSDGYISLTNGATKNLVYFLGNHLIEFENLTSGGYESGVKAPILNEFKLFLNKTEDVNNPFKNMLIKYLTQVFTKTPISDIVGESDEESGSTQTSVHVHPEQSSKHFDTKTILLYVNYVLTFAVILYVLYLHMLIRRRVTMGSSGTPYSGFR